MVNINKLRGKMVEHGLSMGELANKLGIDRSTLYRKMGTTGETFTIREANIICGALNLSGQEAAAIFFSHHVA